MKNLNPIKHYADKFKRESKKSQACGCEYLRGSFRRALADVEGKNRNDSGGTCPKNRDTAFQTVFLGKRHTCGFAERRPSFSCQCPQCQNSDANSRKIIASKRAFSRKLEKFSNFSTLEFPAHDEFSDRKPALFSKKLDTPYCNSNFLDYNVDITKNGTVKSVNFLQPLVTNLLYLDQLLASDYSRTLYLASDSSQPLKHGRKKRTA